MVTAVKPDKREVALTILARMIVRAYLGEIDRGEAGPNAYEDEQHGKDDPLNPIQKSRRSSDRD
jgi:hypothetical protein